MEINEILASKIGAIAAIARTGLAWTEALYERERYERILELSAEVAEILAGGVEPSSASLAAELKLGWLNQVTPGASGYVTPKISTAAACFNSAGNLLLGKRGDSSLWFIPTGWQEVGLTPAENIVKEVREETGIECRPLRLISVRDTRLQRKTGLGITGVNPSALHNIALTFLCEALTSELKLHPLETLEAGFYTEAEAYSMVPERVHFVVKHAFEAWRGELPTTFFDELG